MRRAPVEVHITGRNLQNHCVVRPQRVQRVAQCHLHRYIQPAQRVNNFFERREVHHRITVHPHTQRLADGEHLERRVATRVTVLVTQRIAQIHTPLNRQIAGIARHRNPKIARN